MLVIKNLPALGVVTVDTKKVMLADPFVIVNSIFKPADTYPDRAISISVWSLPASSIALISISIIVGFGDTLKEYNKFPLSSGLSLTIQEDVLPIPDAPFVPDVPLVLMFQILPMFH